MLQEEIVIKPLRIGECYPDLAGFISQHGDKHITQESTDYYKKIKIDGILVRCFIGKTLIGFSASGWNGKNSHHGVTVIHHDFRGQGLGKRLLRKKIEQLPSNFTTSVAEDNLYSRHMCTGVGLIEIDRKQGIKKKGPYTVIIYGKERTNNSRMGEIKWYPFPMRSEFLFSLW